MKRLVRTILCIGSLLVLLAIGARSVWKEVRSHARFDPAGGVPAIEELLSDGLPDKTRILAPYRMWNALLGRRWFPEEGFYLSDDGFLQTGAYHSPEPALAGAREFSAFCGERGLDLLYVVAPSKPRSDADLTDLGLECGRTRTADEFVEGLAASGVPYLDLRPMYEDGFYDWFYLSDHHWTTEAGLRATRIVSEELNQRYGTGLDTSLIADEQLTRIPYEHSWVGETGRRILGPYGPVDDYTLIVPRYDVRLSVEDRRHGMDATGGFEVLIDGAALSSAAPDNNVSLHYTYLQGNVGNMDIRNLDRDSGHILLIRDSFSMNVAPFLCLMTQDLTLWDLRYSTEDLAAYLEEHPDVDAVVVLYTSSIATREALNDFV